MKLKKIMIQFKLSKTIQTIMTLLFVLHLWAKLLFNFTYYIISVSCNGDNVMIASILDRLGSTRLF